MIGTRSIHSQIIGLILFLTVGSFCASTYEPNTNLHIFLKSWWSPVTILLGNYSPEILFISGSVFNQITTKYTRWTMICTDRQYYDNVLIIPLPFPMYVLIVLSTSPTGYRSSEILNSTFPDLYTTFSNYISTSIICTKSPPCPYNLTDLFNILIIWSAVQLSICSTVTNLRFLAESTRRMFRSQT